MDYCYRFKQMCKKADTLLKQYPLTGVWPGRLEHPKFPVKLAQVRLNQFIDLRFVDAENVSE